MKLKDGSTTKDARLGRLYKEDRRDKEYPLELGFGKARPRKLRTTPYLTGPVLDQDNTSACVGYAGRGWLNAAPTTTAGGPTAWECYIGAQEHDEWAGKEPKLKGSSIRGLMKFFQEIGRAGNYLWAESTEDMADWLRYDQGTLMVGITWKVGMDEPDDDGFVSFSGKDLGGHAFLVIWFDKKRDAFLGQNQWGRGWGLQGRFWIPRKELQAAMRDDGESAAAVEIRVA